MTTTATRTTTKVEGGGEATARAGDRARRALRRAAEGPGAAWEKLGPWAAAWLLDRAERRIEAARDRLRRAPTKRHLLVAICDHFEPMWSTGAGFYGTAPRPISTRRVKRWRDGYPELAQRFVDSDGRPPRHSFFFPGDQYDPDLVEPLAELCERGLAECEVHLHHENDSRSSLEDKLQVALERFADHGVVPRQDGEPRWAFIHGNWCLANSRRDGAYCGVDDELELLHELGCYADFTFPSAPDETQPAIVNSIYYPDDPKARRSYAKGTPAAVGTRLEGRPLLVQGPLSLSVRDPVPGGFARFGREGLRALRVPVRIDAAALTAQDPATPSRLETWIDQHVHVRGKPDWVFLKLHTHGASEAQAEALLGEPQLRFHEALRGLRERGDYDVHYVTAREMFNIAKAAMEGKAGSPNDYRDWDVPKPPRAA